MKKLLLALAFLASLTTYAQDFTATVQSYLNNNRTALGLTPQDISDIRQVDQSFSESMQVNNVYLVQLVEGIEVINTNSSFAISQGQVKSASLSFVPAAQAKINATNPSIDAVSAINRAAQNFGLGQAVNIEQIEERPDGTIVFSDGQISQNEIPVKLVYQLMEDNTLRLAWDLSIYLMDGSHYYSVRVDARNGQVISQHDWVVNCSFGNEPHSHDSSGAGADFSMLYPVSATMGGSDQ